MSLRAEDLFEGHDERETWERFAALPADEAERLFDEVKARVDKALRADPEAALAGALLLLEAAHRLPDRAALAQRVHAAALHVSGRTPEAVEGYERARALFAEQGQELEAARVGRSLVDVYQMTGRAADALRAAEEARPVFTAHGEERLLAQLEVNVGNVHFRLDDYAAARAAYGTGRDAFERLGDSVGLAFVGFNLANLETHAHNFDAAEAAFRSARVELEKVGMHVHVADCDYGLAYLESRRGRFADAVRGLEEARAVYADGGKPSGVPLCDKDLAEIYLRLDARHDALTHARRAAESFAAQGLDYERAQADVLAGQAHARLGARAVALECFARAEDTFSALGNDVWRTTAALQRSLLRTDHGAALSRLRDACAQLAGSEHELLEQVARLALARALVEAGAAREAVELLQSLRGSGSGLDELIRAELLACLADAFVALGARARAVDALREAVEVTDSTYSRVPGSDVRIAFFRDRHAAFLQLANLLSEDGGGEAPWEALDLLERGRARSLTRSAAQIEVGDGAFVAAREHLDLLLGQRLDAELGSLRGAPEPAPTDAELHAAHETLRRCARELEHEQPAAGAADVRAFARRLAPDELTLAYMPSAAGWCVFVIGRDRVRRVDLQLTAPRLGELSERLTAQLAKYRHGTAYWQRHEARIRRSAERLLDALGTLLLAPVADELSAARRLSICPYGELHGLPFHAFGLGGAPLVASHEVSYLPKLALLPEDAREGPPGPFVVTGGGEESAPAIEQELEALAALFPSRARRVEPDEVVAGVRDGSLGAGALHVAAHGSFQPSSPLFSGVRLGAGFVTAYDVSRARIDCALVTLSGCETGREQAVGGEELFGLQRAFLAAGTRSVVSSLWTVGDRDSARCMQRLYAHLAQGREVRSALAAAQRELMDETPHPFSWAPFVLAGDPRTRLT